VLASGLLCSACCLWLQQQQGWGTEELSGAPGNRALQGAKPGWGVQSFPSIWSILGSKASLSPGASRGPEHPCHLEYSGVQSIPVTWSILSSRASQHPEHPEHPGVQIIPWSSTSRASEHPKHPWHLTHPGIQSIPSIQKQCPGTSQRWGIRRNEEMPGCE